MRKERTEKEKNDRTTIEVSDVTRKRLKALAGRFDQTYDELLKYLMDRVEYPT